MKPQNTPSPVNPRQQFDYLLIGHVTRDLTPTGPVLGGTVSYSARMAAVLGLRVGIITAAPLDMDLSALGSFPIHRIPSETATTFENIQTPRGRIQYLHQQSKAITADDIPLEWRNAALVHLGPVANEIDSGLVDAFPNSFIGITAQGCLRAADEQHRVHYHPWSQAPLVLPRCDAVIISTEDVENQEERIQEFLKHSKILVVTEGEYGARVHWKGDVRHFSAPKVEVVDLTGAGDIFAAVFFARLQATRDPWLACAQAVHLASLSVTRRGVDGVPTAQEVQSALMEIVI